MVKVPVNPFIKWLVYALGESSTIGSVILGGWILKIGSYGIYRINMNNEYILINMIIIVTIWSCINSSIAIYY
jgi:NADH:ubiquinone oxidoreductase subunit 4 (subunit M)